jgi:hypothetical protein
LLWSRPGTESLLSLSTRRPPELLRRRAAQTLLLLRTRQLLAD